MVQINNPDITFCTRYFFISVNKDVDLAGLLAQFRYVFIEVRDKNVHATGFT